MGRAGDFDVAEGKTERSEDLPDRHALPDGLHALAGADTADFLVFKAREGIWEEGGRPDGVVVGEDDDICGCVLDAMAHLEAFVGKGNGEDADAFWVYLVGEVLEGSEHLLFCDDEDLLGLSNEPAVGCLFEFLACIDGGYNNGDIF